MRKKYWKGFVAIFLACNIWGGQGLCVAAGSVNLQTTSEQEPDNKLSLLEEPDTVRACKAGEITGSASDRTESDNKLSLLEEEIAQTTLEGIYQEGAVSSGENAVFLKRYLADSILLSAEETIYQGLLNHENKIDVWMYHMTAAELKSTYQHVINTHADLFFVAAGYSYSHVNGKATTITPQYNMTASETQNAQKIFQTETGKIVALVDADWSESKKAIFLHDYICTHFEYDTSYSIYDAYQFLTKKKGVCQAYTLLYSYLLGQVGIESTVAESTAMGHIWNVVRINNNWYHVDVTWDDPTLDIIGRAQHNNFLKSDSAIVNASTQKHHDWTCNYTCLSTTYDNAFWNEIYVSFACDNGTGYCLDKKSGKISSCDLDQVKLLSTIYTITDKWSVIGGAATWNGTFSGFAAYNGKLYYNTPDKICAIDVNTRKTSTVWTLANASSRHIYNFYMDENVIYYTVGKTPSEKLSVSGSVTVPKKPEEETKPDKEFSNEKLTMDTQNQILYGVSGGTTVEELADSSNYQVEVYWNGSSIKKADSVRLATGDVVRLIDKKGAEVASYEICIKGEVNGDGLINVEDMEGVQKAILSIGKLEGVYKQAAILDEERTTPTALDMEAIQKDILGIKKIAS